VSGPNRETVAGRTYLELRKKAKAEGRTTDELLQLSALEAFVDRLAGSTHANNLVLKGASCWRRMTRDALPKTWTSLRTTSPTICPAYQPS
jgi:hypothetical protein